MEHTDLEAAILNLVRQTNYRPVKPRVIAAQLNVPRDQAADVKRAIKALVKQGQLAYGANHLVSAASGQVGNRVTGVFRRNANGFGFVRPIGTARALGNEADIYIAADKAGDASTGDVVLVRLDKHHGGRPGPRGEIVQVVERETHRFVGTYFENAGTAFVQVDGTLFSRPIVVGDPGAKNARPDDKVVFEMVRFPSYTHEGEGVVTEVLGPRGMPGIDTLSIIREFNLPEHFDDDAVEESRLESEHFDESAIGTRLDLTAETVITIDPVDARDFDDAISLEKTAKGHWRLGVHIADVTHFVRPATALDREARGRATSVYLPDRVIPMLPEIISNGLASLQPDRMRYAKTAIMEFTPEGVRVGVDLHSTAIKSKRRFTYEEVDEYLAHPVAWRRKLTPEVHALVGRMHELAMILRQRRLRNGALELSMPEIKIDLDADGRVSGAHRVESTVSHQIIEEFMLAANEAVAETLAAADLHFLRRIHESPDPRKLKALGEFMAELGLATGSLESRFEIQKLLAAVEGRPEQHAVNYAVLRSLQRAVYSPKQEGHYALGSECYCHFTSPIRRYPDLTVHRLVDALLHKKKPRNDFEEAAALGEHCSEQEQRAEAAERELTKVKLLDYLSDRLGEEMDAVITGVESFGLFCQGLELPAEGLIPVNALQDDYYRFDRATHTLSGYRSGNAFRLGDLVRVSVARVDIERRELDFRLVQRKKRPAAPVVSPPKKPVGKAPRAAASPRKAKGHKPPKTTRKKAARKGKRK
ncbi:MAG: ribonuclease R [Pirellulales bacterium]